MVPTERSSTNTWALSELRDVVVGGVVRAAAAEEEWDEADALSGE